MLQPQAACAGQAIRPQPTVGLVGDGRSMKPLSSSSSICTRCGFARQTVKRNRMPVSSIIAVGERSTERMRNQGVKRAQKQIQQHPLIKRLNKGGVLCKLLMLPGGGNGLETIVADDDFQIMAMVLDKTDGCFLGAERYWNLAILRVDNRFFQLGHRMIVGFDNFLDIVRMLMPEARSH
jgi:hypothetical protein